MGEIVELGASIVYCRKQSGTTRSRLSRAALCADTKEYRISERDLSRQCAARCRTPPDAPVHFVSAKENTGIEHLLESAYSLKRKMLSSVTTNKLNSCVSKLLENNPPKYVSNKRFKAYYCVKVASRPYTVRMFCNDAGSLTDSYRRYLVKGLREKLNLGGVSIKLELVGKPKRSASERIGEGKNESSLHGVRRQLRSTA